MLIAGIGNVFFGDDGFGVAVAQRLQQTTWPAAVRVKDFGIHGFDLAVELLDGYDVAIFVDAVQRGGLPGALVAIELEVVACGMESPSPHAMRLEEVFRVVRAWGGRLPQLFLVGCEPETLEPSEAAGAEAVLSPPVARAVDEVVRLIRDLVEQLLHEKPCQVS
ncbi:MAG: hydrogenase maturation protease [Planctomycetia bacterium]|nr:hydrogenase maturation protease [Planctomycetia bacterium]